MEEIFTPARGVLLWCILVFTFGMGVSGYTARWYHLYYKKEKEKAKMRDETLMKEKDFEDITTSEVDKLAKASCPFAGLVKKPNHNISQEPIGNGSGQQQCPVSGFYTPLLDSDEQSPPVPPTHPSKAKKQ
jgi:hypothetical protein